MPQGIPSRAVDGVLPLLTDADDAGFHTEAVADVVRGTRTAETVSKRSWLTMLRETDGVAVRLAGTGRYAYYLIYTGGEPLTLHSENHAVREVDPEGEYVDSLFRQYEPFPVVAEEVSAIGE